MFETLSNAWKIPDLRKKMLYTIFMLIIFRFGSFIPVPWLNAQVLSAWVESNENSIFGLMDTFSGGAFSNATIFAMGITPYINSSIIMQLLTVAIPALERLQKEGEEGRKKIKKITRYVTVVLGFIQAAGLYIGLLQSNVQSATGATLTAISNPNALKFFTIVLTFTAGTAFLMWLGEQMTEKGVGNGISLLIFAGIVSRIPSMAMTLWQAFKDNVYVIGIILVFAVLVIAFVVMVNSAERRIPVQYAKRVVGRKTYGGQTSHIPLKVAMAGVIPIIFAMSIMAFPGTIVALANPNPAAGSFGAWVNAFFSQSNPGYSIMYFLLIIAFTYFYTAITFNPIEVANNMKKNNGYIPGIRPGKPTADYITRILNRITLAGAAFLGIIAILPMILALVNSSLAAVSIGGTSLLIVVGVALETTKQIEAQMLMRHYKGFLE